MKNKFFSTARLTGLFYFGLAITGMLAFLFARSALYVENDALATAGNFAAQGGLARFGIAAELALVGFQVLTALWFFKLFSKVNSFAAMLLSTFGVINAILILVASAFWLSALYVVSSNGSVPPTAEQIRGAFMLFEVHENIWVVGKLFFGLWLIPMGYLVKASKMSKILGWLLIGGGVGYVLSLFIGVLFPSVSSSTLEMITIPATIGEFWMIGYLLLKRIEV